MIRPIAHGEAPAASALLTAAVGPGWVTADDLAPTPERRVVVADRGGVVVGVASASLRPWRDALPRDAAAREAFVTLTGAGPHRVVVLDMAVVAPSARGAGRYRDLLDDRVAWARRVGATVAMSWGWTPDDGCHIAPAMRRAGFTELARVGDLYAGSRVPEAARCVRCGRPCTCDATLFARLL